MDLLGGLKEKIYQINKERKNFGGKKEKTVNIRA